MGGGGNSTATAVEEVATNPEFTGQMREFGIGQPQQVQNQLNTAGLGGMIDPAQFQQSSLPIFANPAEIELYLQSIGKTPVDAATSSSTTSSTSNGDYPWYAEPHNIPKG
jgi:hypothetical protein